MIILNLRTLQSKHFMKKLDIGKLEKIGSPFFILEISLLTCKQ